jgi:hypothetical protein
MATVTADEFMVLGLKFAGHPRVKSLLTNLRRFKGWYGASPETCAQIFSDLKTTDINEARIKDNEDPSRFLMAMHFLRAYRTEEQTAGTFRMNEKTARKWCWKYAKKIQALKGKKVSNSNER